VFLLQNLFDITVVVEPHRIALVLDDLGLFFQLLDYLGFCFGIDLPRRCLSCVIILASPVKLNNLKN
jgi:hypothetical protein